MQDFFVKSGKKKSDTETMQAKVMDVGQGTSSQQDQTWTLKQMAVKAEIIATLHFAAHNVFFWFCKEPTTLLSTAISLFSDSKASINWTNQDVIHGFLWIRPLLQANDNKRYHRRAIHTTHYTLMKLCQARQRSIWICCCTVGQRGTML